MSGSIYQRKDGRWVGAVQVDGRRVTRYGKTREEAEQKLREVLTAPVLSTPPTPKPPRLGAWVEQWLALRAPELRPSTYQTYRDALELFRPLYATRLDALTALGIALQVASLRQAGRGGLQVQRGFKILRRCLDTAVRLGQLASNPLTGQPNPSWQAAEKVYWSVEETRRFLAYALGSGHKHAPLCVFLATTGVRISEALALTWDDLDRERQQVRVTRALVRVGSLYHELPPKSKTGRRVVALPSKAQAALALLPAGREHLFWDDSPPRQTNLSRALRALCREAGVPRVHVHGLRHVAATMALKASRDAHAVKRRLGHSQVSTTIGMYGYALDAEDEVAGALDTLLDG